MRAPSVAASALGLLSILVSRAPAFGAAPPALTAYQTDCQKANVPLPPPFGAKGGDGKNLWNQVGFPQKAGDQSPMPNDLIFASQLPTTEVWVYNDSAKGGTGGICYALPRKDAGGKIVLLGVICQAAKTAGDGKVRACFWDNIGKYNIALADLPPVPATPTPAQRDDYNEKFLEATRFEDTDITKLDVTKFMGGDQLRENCTGCHRGDNAYNVIPFTPEEHDTGHELAGQLDKGMGYVPLGGQAITAQFAPVQGSWGNPVLDPVVRAKITSCRRCHSLPAPSLRFCAIFSSILFDGAGDPEVYPAGVPPVGATNIVGKLLMSPLAGSRSMKQRAEIKTYNDACAAAGVPY